MINIFNILKATTSVSLLMLLPFLLFAQKRIILKANTELVDGNIAPYNIIEPGDTLVLESAIWKLLIFRNIEGTPSKPIIITNASDGTAEFNSHHYFGISVRHCSHIRITGNGNAKEQYGIRILNIRGTALGIGFGSTDVEMDHIEIAYSLYSGITAKTEPDCNYNRYNFLQYNTVIHDNYIHHTGTEGMYIGSSFYDGQHITCNGHDTIVLPPLLKNVKVYDNIVEYTGWDGIQVSCAVNTEIYHNQIRYDSQQKAEWQMNGIIVGQGVTGSIYDNIIKDGEGSGIFSNSLGDLDIYNNVILNPGMNNTLASSQYGIYLDDKNTYTGMYFRVYNNLIINSRGEGIRFNCNAINNKHLVANNAIAKLVANTSTPTINTTTSFIHVNGELADTRNNYTTYNEKQLGYEEMGRDNFRMKEISPLIDAGCKIINGSFTADFYGDAREQGFGMDIGPTESNYYKASSTILTCENDLNGYPNPLTRENNFFTFTFKNEVAGFYSINIINQMGKTISNVIRDYYDQGVHQIVIPSLCFQKGLNIVQCAAFNESKGIVVIKE